MANLSCMVSGLSCGGVIVFNVFSGNMDANESADWNSRLFKRLYQSGVDCRFVGVDWEGNSGWLGCYQWNVENALNVQGAPGHLDRAVPTADIGIERQGRGAEGLAAHYISCCVGGEG